MKRVLFQSNFYVKFKAPNSQDLINYIESIDQSLINNQMFDWGKMCSSDKIALKSQELMKFISPNIKELYAIGPAISMMMEGYIEKDRMTSLRGTLVPATTINKTIAKIPLLGDILVGRKSGEGVFGVSFKIKGPPNNLKSTVNPIKTLTPRFITRTLEKIKGS